MEKEGLVVVSAKVGAIKRGDLKYNFNVIAAGLVRTEQPLVDLVVRDFESLKKVDERFQEVKYEPDKQVLFLHLAAMSFHARMYLKLVETKSKGLTSWDWECIEGSFKGMKGIIRIEGAGRHRTEISIVADHDSIKMPLPKALMGVGLEVIARQVAEKMRTYIHDKAKSKGLFFNEL